MPSILLGCILYLSYPSNLNPINFHRHQLPVVTALNTPLDIEHSSWRCVRSKVGRRLVRRCQEVYFFLSSLRDSPSTYTHRYETTQREVRKRWCGGLWKVIRKVSNFLTFHLQIGYLGSQGEMESVNWESLE